jgi:hypothetical protein
MYKIRVAKLYYTLRGMVLCISYSLYRKLKHTVNKMSPVPGFNANPAGMALY